MEVFYELEKTSVTVKKSDLEYLLWERYGMTNRTVRRLLSILLKEDIIRQAGDEKYRKNDWEGPDEK